LLRRKLRAPGDAHQSLYTKLGAQTELQTNVKLLSVPVMYNKNTNSSNNNSKLINL